MDHEIENDVDVQGTRCEDTEPVRLKEHGLGEGCDSSGNRGVEALEMTDGDDAALRLGESQDVVCLGEGGGEGLFDEDVDAGEKKLLSDSGVMAGGDADGRGVERQVGGEQLGYGREGGNVVGGGAGAATLGEGINERDELDEVGMSDLEFAIDAKVITPEGTRADNCDAKRRHGYFCAATPGSGDSTATRQRV